MGGEPTMHPQFVEICGLYKKYFPRSQRGLFTAGGKFYEKHKELIDDTFGIILFNNHEVVGVHQPILVASEDVIKDETLRNELIDPSITPRGAYFCEVAGTIDNLFDGPGGFAIEPGWWQRSLSECSGQRNEFCRSCSAAIPMEQHPHNQPFDYISPSNAKRLQEAGSPLVRNGKYEILDTQYTREDIKRMRKTKHVNKDPQKHTPHGSNYWFRCEDKKYFAIYYYNWMKMKLGIN
jgi:hypothetical protein